MENQHSAAGSSEVAAVRVFAGFFSYVFHPLFITTYVTAFLLYVHPYAFAGLEPKLKMFRMASVIVSTLFLPGLAVLLARQLDFVKSIYLHTQRDRIIPYIISLTFYFWAWYVFKNLNDSPEAIKEFLLGAFLGVCVAWMANIRFKISMHSTAVGGMLMFFILQSFKDPVVGGLYVSVAVFITGLVCTARLIMGGHTRFEVYAGLFAGALAQVAATWFA